jgi:hypothetical protein
MCCLVHGFRREDSNAATASGSMSKFVSFSRTLLVSSASLSAKIRYNEEQVRAVEVKDQTSGRADIMTSFTSIGSSPRNVLRNGILRSIAAMNKLRDEVANDLVLIEGEGITNTVVNSN